MCVFIIMYTYNNSMFPVSVCQWIRIRERERGKVYDKAWMFVFVPELLCNMYVCVCVCQIQPGQTLGSTQLWESVWSRYQTCSTHFLIIPYSLSLQIHCHLYHQLKQIASQSPDQHTPETFLVRTSRWLIHKPFSLKVNLLLFPYVTPTLSLTHSILVMYVKLKTDKTSL